MDGLVCLYEEDSERSRLSRLPLGLAQTVSVRKCRPGEKPGLVFPNYREDGTCRRVRPCGQTTLEYDGPVEVEPKLTTTQHERMAWLRCINYERRWMQEEFNRHIFAAYFAKKDLFCERKRIIRKPGGEIQLVTFD